MSAPGGTASAMVLVRALIAIVAIGLAGDAAITSAILAGEISGAAKVGRIVRQADPAEIPIFGSSRAQGSYLPEVLAPAAFNYGIDGIGYHAVEFFLDKELRKARRTPVIINLDYEWWHERIGDVSYWIASAGDADVRRLLGKGLEAIHRVPLVRYYGRFDEYLGFALNERLRVTKTVNRGGVFLVAPLPRATFESMVRERLRTPLTFSVDPSMDARFRTRLLSHPDRPFVVVVAPYHRSYATSLQNPAAFQAYLDSLRGIPNVTVIDRSTAPYDDELFMNTGHLNYAGARRFSAELRSQLGPLLAGATGEAGGTARRGDVR